MPTKKPRFSITLEDDLFERLENFRFDKRYQTRNEAIVELIRLGLEVVETRENNPAPIGQYGESKT